LADDNNDSIYVYEMANLTEDDYIVLGNEEYGHLVQVTQLYNSSSSYTSDKVVVQDVITGDTYTTTFTGVCTGTGSCGTMDVEGKQYAVTFNGQTGDDGWVQFKYPTADSDNVYTYVVYPTIGTSDNNQVALYEPLKVDLENFNKSSTDYNKVTLSLPDGDGYTDAAFIYVGNVTTDSAIWTVGGTPINTSSSTYNWTTVTVGQLTYNFTGNGGAANVTQIYLTDPENSSTNLAEPSVIIFEGKGETSGNDYEAIVVNLETAPAGTSDSGVGVDDVLFSSTTHYSATLASNSDITQDLDKYGTLTTKDAGDSDQTTATVSLPSSQVYAKVFVGEVDADISTSTGSGSATELGAITVYDNEAAAMSGKNLIVVGGSCINSVAAELLGQGACGADFEALTGVSEGGYLIESFDKGGKVALLVAGYNAADTTKAATYLVNNAVNTAVGTKMTGTSAQTATVVTE